MSDHSTEEPAVGIPDEQLPEDLRPTDDNPLAQPLAPGETAPGLGIPDPADGLEAGQDEPDRSGQPGA